MVGDHHPCTLSTVMVMPRHAVVVPTSTATAYRTARITDCP